MTSDNTNSLSWPRLFDVSRNCVAVKKNNASIVSRTRLLILSDPTELYNDPTFGVGLRKYLWQYNTENTKAIIRDRIVEQLRDREPSVIADKTQFADELLYTGTPTDNTIMEYNQLKMTVQLMTKYEDKVSVELNSSDLQKRVDAGQVAYSSFLGNGGS